MGSRRYDFPRGMSLREAVDRLFADNLFDTPFFSDRPEREYQRIPINMFELPEGVMIVAPMPGLQAEDVELSITGKTIALRGRRTPGQEDKEYMVREWEYGPYNRTIELPFPVDPDRVIATLNNGVLTVNLRRSDAAMPRRIHVRNATERSATAGETHRSPEGQQLEKGPQDRIDLLNT